MTARNVDGTINKKEILKSYVKLKFQINLQKFKKWFYVTRLGKQKIILGFPWLHKHNPIIHWKTRKITWKDFQLNFWKWFEKKKPIPKMTMEEQIDKEEEKNHTQNPINIDANSIFMELWKEININKINVATKLAIKGKKKKQTEN